MPEFNYQGRDRQGQLRSGQRQAASEAILGAELIKEGIFPIQIKLAKSAGYSLDFLRNLIRRKKVGLVDLAVFARQMQLLYEASVPIHIALKQLSSHSRNRNLGIALRGALEHISKGQNLSTSMSYYPDVFSPLMINIVQVGENSGQLGKAFQNLHEYLQFEASSRKSLKASFRYPAFVLSTIALAIFVLNIFVIPRFSQFYVSFHVDLPWETKILIYSSKIMLGYGIYILIGLSIIIVSFLLYIRSPQGKYQWDKFILHIPIVKTLMNRMILIRFTQAFAIVLDSGLSITASLRLIQKLISNTYISKQIQTMSDDIDKGLPFVHTIEKITLFSELELQILSVGERNGELAKALNYIAYFHNQEIEYDIKKLNDYINPIMMAFVSAIVLIMALGIYLPIWNLSSAMH